MLCLKEAIKRHRALRHLEDVKKVEIISIQTAWFLMLDVFVCSVPASGWHWGRPEGNISLIYWSLFSLSSIAAVWCPGEQRDSLAEEEVEQELGLASAHADKLLFTVQIYDSFYVPNRKPLRFIADNGTVGNTPWKLADSAFPSRFFSQVQPTWADGTFWGAGSVWWAGLQSCHIWAADGSSNKGEGRKVGQANGWLCMD